MDETYYVGAYWGVRRETALECARRAELFFQLLARCDPALAQWYYPGRGFPLELPGWPLRMEVERLEEFLLKNRYGKGVSKKVVEDAGFGTMMWNASGNPIDIHLNCGDYSPWGGNGCVLVSRDRRPTQERIWSAPVLVEIITSMVQAWDPDFAVVASDEIRDLVKKERFEVDVGWLTYLSRRLGSLPPLPAPVRIEPVGTVGWLLILSPERMSASNPEHVALTMRIRALLDGAGLIARPQPTPLGP